MPVYNMEKEVGVSERAWARGWSPWTLPLVYFVVRGAALRLRTFAGLLHLRCMRHVTYNLAVQVQPPHSERWLHPLLFYNKQGRYHCPGLRGVSYPDVTAR